MGSQGQGVVVDVTTLNRVVRKDISEKVTSEDLEKVRNRAPGHPREQG